MYFHRLSNQFNIFEISMWLVTLFIKFSLLKEIDQSKSYHQTFLKSSDLLHFWLIFLLFLISICFLNLMLLLEIVQLNCSMKLILIFFYLINFQFINFLFSYFFLLCLVFLVNLKTFILKIAKKIHHYYFHFYSFNQNKHANYLI